MRPRVIVDIMWSSQRHFSIERYDHWLVWTDTIGNSSNVWVFHSLPKTCPAGPMGVPYTFCWRRRRWRASMFLMWLLGMRRVTPSFQIFLWEEAVLEKPGAMLRMTATLWAGMRWGTPFPGQVVRLCNILTRFPGRFTEYVLLALKLKVQGRTIPKISRTVSKISRTISKISRTSSKVSRNKGLASAPERKRHWTWTVGRFNLLAVGSRSWGPPLSCLMFWNWPSDKPQLLSCSGCVWVEQDMFLRLHHDKKKDVDGVICGLLFLYSTAHAATALERYWKMRSYVYVILCLFFSVL